MSSEPIRDKKRVRKLAGYYLEKGNLRNYLLIMLGVYTALRISDLLRLTWGDVYDFARGRFRKHISLIEKKTGKSKVIALNPKAVVALRLLFAALGGERAPAAEHFIFRNNRKNGAAISRVQAWRIIKKAADETDSGRVSCHSLRKTFGYHAWHDGAQAVVLMDIYNHSSYEVTRRYLGICQDDRDAVYMKAAY